MQIKISTWFIVFSLIFSYGSVFSQEIDNDTKKETKNKDITSLPQGYSHEFPMYPLPVVYHRKLRVPQKPKMPDNPAEMANFRPKFTFKDAFSIAHKLPVEQTFKARQWYLINAKQAGYTEKFYSENRMDNNVEIVYEKTVDGIFKSVRVVISNGRILIIAMKDEKVTNKAKAGLIRRGEADKSNMNPVQESE